MHDYGKVFDDMYEYYRLGDSSLKQSFTELRNFLETYKRFVRDDKAGCWMKQINFNIDDRAGIIKQSFIRGFREKAYAEAKGRFVEGARKMFITGEILKDVKTNGLTPKTMLEIQKMLSSGNTEELKFLFHFLPKEKSKKIVQVLASDIEKSNDNKLIRKADVINNL